MNFIKNHKNHHFYFISFYPFLFYKNFLNNFFQKVQKYRYLLPTHLMSTCYLNLRQMPKIGVFIHHAYTSVGLDHYG